MRTLPFYQVDVFTDRPFAGNPLAVFPEAEGLTAVQMQAIASEMNLSETTFVLPAEGGGRRAGAHLHARARAAVRRPPERGHGLRAGPARHGRASPSRSRGSSWSSASGRPPSTSPCATACRSRRPCTSGRPCSTRRRRAARSPPSSVSTSRTCTPSSTPCRSTPASATRSSRSPRSARSARVSLDLELAGDFERRHAEIYPCAFTGQDEPWVEARGLFPFAGITEDPATGSAAGPLAAYMAREGVLPPERGARRAPGPADRPPELPHGGRLGDARRHHRRARRRGRAARPPGRALPPGLIGAGRPARRAPAAHGLIQSARL